ncbi:uncharacterized protein LOC141617790 [Silene latifolia]|uniref:uncharacterized protein LOC141617790 n=1 Tax=Silene latifolia TaxID=37657 RepID=UPI003D7722D3
MLIFPYLVLCADLFHLPSFPYEVASLSKLFGPPPEHRTFPNLVQDSASAMKETAAEEKENCESMSTSSAKSKISLDDVLAQREKKRVEVASKPAEKRKSTPAPGSGPRPKRRSAAVGRAKEQTPIEATPLAVRPPLPGHGPPASANPPVPDPARSLSPAIPASGATSASGATPASGAIPTSKSSRAAGVVAFTFPDDFGKAKSARNLGLMDQLLFPAPKSALGIRALHDLVDRAAEHSFESFQMSLFLRRKVPLLEAEKVVLLKQTKVVEESKFKIQSELDKS